MSRFSLRRLVAALVFMLAFVVNPAYVVGCSASPEPSAAEKARAEADLLAKLEDINATASFSFDADGEQYELLLELSQQHGEDVSARGPASKPRFTPVAHACGNHTFYQSASACVTYYELAVEGTLTVRRLGASAETLASDLPVRGVVPDYGDVTLSVAEQGELVLTRSSEGAYELHLFAASDLGDDSLDLSFERAPARD